MSKFKIEAEIEIDFDKLFPHDDPSVQTEEEQRQWEKSFIFEAMQDLVTYTLMNHVDWMCKKEYLKAKPHLDVKDEVAKEFRDNFKIERHETTY